MELLIKFLATFLIVLMALGALYFFRRKSALYLILGLAGYGLQQIVIFLIKIFIKTTRPYIALNEKPLVMFAPTDYSFPSGHACFAFFMATLVFIRNRRLGVLFYFVAILISWGRVLANVHYPIDVVGGAVLGVGIGWVIDYFMRRVLHFS